VFTDSGGIQKEAYILKKPCLTLRTETEWLETVEAGWNTLVNYHDSGAASLIRDFRPPAEHPDLFGNNVGERMAGLMSEWL
jgi:UDP-N-acetylglucosamine 2-epimerase